MKKIIFLALVVIVLSSGCTSKLISGFAANETMEGPFTVVNVIDGDTVLLNNSEKVRLSGINTPETGECYYQDAKNKLAELVLNKDVFLEKDKTERDKYGRLLRYIYADNLSANFLLVEEGFAKVYDKYSYDTKYYFRLKQIEEKPMENSLGVWACVDLKENCEYVASKNSEFYHTPDCKWAKRIKPENLVCFNSRAEAEKQGHEPHTCAD